MALFTLEINLLETIRSEEVWVGSLVLSFLYLLHNGPSCFVCGLFLRLLLVSIL
jgi:hypothetical protein